MEEVDVAGIAAALLGGLALLLFGIGQMSAAVRALLGDRVRDALLAAARTPVRGFVSGAAAAGAMQSSTAVVLLAMTFLGNGALALDAAVALLLGAQVGTTLVNQLTALKLARLALLLVGGGYFARRAARAGSAAGAAAGFAFGLGVMFHGTEILTGAVDPLRRHEPFLAALGAVAASPPLACAAACVFTLLVQASSATVSVAQLLAGTGVVTTRQALALVLGANIGTTGTALLVGVASADRNSKRFALCYLGLKLAPALLSLPLLAQGEAATRAVSAADAGPAQLIANFHSAWNVVFSLCFLPFVDQLVAIMLWLVPGDDRARGSRAMRV